MAQKWTGYCFETVNRSLAIHDNVIVQVVKVDRLVITRDADTVVNRLLDVLAVNEDFPVSVMTR